MISSRKNRLSDLMIAARSWRIWFFLAMRDVLVRYRGSVLGPFWITLSTAITVYSMGYLYGILLKIDRTTYFPYFTTGLIAWTFISMIVNESTRILSESKSYMENIRLPCLVYIFRLVFRNVIVLAHNLLVYLSIILIYHLELNVYSLWFVPALAVLCLNGIFYGTILAFISARFPDVGSMISSILQVVFFVTPIMWPPSALPSKFHLYLALNPFAHFVSLLRNPLMGLPFGVQDLIGIGCFTALGFVFFTFVMRVYSKRVIFWL